MKRYIFTVALIAAGCETNETDMTITHVVIPDFDDMTNTCTLDPGGAPKADPVSLDTSVALALKVPFAVTNNLVARDTDFSPSDVPQSVNTAAEITVTRFAVRFECDTSAYSGATFSGLILPRIDPATSFCLDRRADTQVSQFNADILPAYGGAIPAGGASVVTVRVIPHELGYAVDELFEIAKLADICCRGTGCSGAGGGTPECQQLQDIFAGIDPSLNAIGQSGQINPTLQRFADYAVFDGEHIRTADPSGRYLNVSTPAFSMYARGQLEGITGYGEVVESNNYSLAMDLCRNCGVGGMTKPEFACIRE